MDESFVGFFPCRAFVNRLRCHSLLTLWAIRTLSCYVWHTWQMHSLTICHQWR